MKNTFTLCCFLLIFTISKSSFSQWECGDTLIDYRDGQSYPTVKIGTQCWLAKNLNIGKMLKGGDISTNNDTIEKYCYGDNETNCDIYGGLYIWDEMMNYTNTESSQGICPDGWYVPSDQEMKELEIALGMKPETAELYNTWRGTDQGTQLKSGGSSGYNALLSGARISVSSFMQLNSYEFIHTSTEAGNYAWRRCVRNDASSVGRFNSYPKTYALSVRCILNYKTVNTNNLNNNQVQIYFANATKTLNINFDQTLNEKIVFALYDMQGKKILSDLIQTDSHAIQIPIPNLNNGIYIATVFYDNNLISKKIYFTY